jgi:hypothetical protein
MTTPPDELLILSDWEFAKHSQGACNLSGLAHSLSKVITKVWAEARVQGHGTDWVNNHPIVRLYVEQMYYLAGLQKSSAYFEASDAVEAKIKELKAVID